MISKNSRNPAWRVNQSLQPKLRNPEELDRLAQAMVKEIKTRGHARDFRDLPEHIKSDPDGWGKIIRDNEATGAINVLVSLGGTVSELEYVIRKMYSLDRSLFLPKGWGGFLDNKTGETKPGIVRKHINYQAGTSPNNSPAKGFVFECRRPLKDLGNDDYFHVIGIWAGSPNQGKIFPSIVEVKKSEEKSDSDEKRGKIMREYNKKSLYDFFRSRGFFFSHEVLTRYFLSLKTKPFVILTGISGTGKTKIAQIFADYICQDAEKSEREKRIAFIPVRPDWLDNKGLLGFYNILDETYHETPLLNLLLKARNNPDIAYFVILDEMNLAKIEQYFSDFLSIMESRTSDNRKGEPLFLHSINKVKTLGGIDIPGKIYIPENIFFTGTVNVDETTYMFSPKVLDRANVIEFNEVDLEGYRSGSGKDDQFCLATSNVTNRLVSKEIEPFCSSRDFNKLKTIIVDDNDPFEELINRLKSYNLHFGYRVINEISRFVWLSKDFLGDYFDPNIAFDIQILQKILPKFHGTQGKLEAPLKDLLSFCYGQPNLKENVPNEMIQKAEELDEKAVYPRSAKKIAQMLKNLRNQGYTSFIE